MVSGVNFLTGILFARFLGIQEFGRFTLVWMGVLFVSSIQMAIITSPMMSIGPKQSEKERPAYYGAVVSHQVCFASLSFLLLYVGAKLSAFIFPDWNIKDLALPLASVTFFFQMQDFFRRFYFTQGRHFAAFCNDAISYLGQLTLLLCLFFSMPLKTTGVLWIIALTSAAAVLVGGLSFGSNYRLQGNFKDIFWRHWSFSRWLTATALMQWATGNLFNIFAGGILGLSAVGALRASQNIIAVCHVLFHGLENIVPARASRQFYEHGVVGLKKYLFYVAKIGGISTAVLLAIVGLWPEYWLVMFYGPEYQGHGIVLRFLAIAYFLMFAGLILRVALRTIEFTKPIFISYCISTAISLMLSFRLIKSFNVAGAAFIPVVSQVAVIGVLYFSLLKKTSSSIDE